MQTRPSLLIDDNLALVQKAIDRCYSLAGASSWPKRLYRLFSRNSDATAQEEKAAKEEFKNAISVLSIKELESLSERIEKEGGCFRIKSTASMIMGIAMVAGSLVGAKSIDDPRSKLAISLSGTLSGASLMLGGSIRCLHLAFVARGLCSDVMAQHQKSEKTNSVNEEVTNLNLASV